MMQHMRKVVTKYLVPHEDNNFEPHLFRDGTIAAVLIVVVGVFAASVFGRLYVDESGMRAAVISSVVADLANSERAKENLPVLAYNTTLEAAAKMKADDMASKTYFAHTSPEGLTPWFWFQKAGYSFFYAGENLAVDFDESDEVTRAWMQSPTHRANILNGRFSEIGIATAEGTHKGHKTTYVVQMFGTPAIAAAVAKAPVTPPAVVPPTPQKTNPQIAKTVLDPVVRGAETEMNVKPIAESTETPNQDFIAVETTDTNLEPAAVVSSEPVTVRPNASIVQRFIIDPSTLMQIIYMVLGSIVLIGIILRIVIEFRRHHTRHVLAGAFAIVFMFGLYAAYHMFFPALTVVIQ